MTEKRGSPVEDCTAKGSRRARPAQKLIPDLVREVLRNCRRREAYLTGPTSKTERHNLSFRLTCLDLRCHERAVGESSSRKNTVIVLIAYLLTDGKVRIRIGTQTRELTLAKSMTGSPPVPLKI